MFYFDPHNTDTNIHQAANDLKHKRAVMRRNIKELNPNINFDLLENVIAAQLSYENNNKIYGRDRIQALKNKNRKRKYNRKW